MNFGLVTGISLHPLGLGLLDWESDIANITCTNDFELYLRMDYSGEGACQLRLVSVTEGERVIHKQTVTHSQTISLGQLAIGEYLIEIRLPNNSPDELSEPGSAILASLLTVYDQEDRLSKGWNEPKLVTHNVPTIEEFLDGKCDFQIIDRLPSTYSLAANFVDHLGNNLHRIVSHAFRYDSSIDWQSVLEPIQVKSKSVDISEIYKIELGIETNGQFFPQDIVLLNERVYIQFENIDSHISLHYRGCVRNDIRFQHIAINNPLLLVKSDVQLDGDEFNEFGLYKAQCEDEQALGILLPDVIDINRQVPYNTEMAYNFIKLCQKIQHVQNVLKPFVAEDNYSKVKELFNVCISRQLVIALLKPSTRDSWVHAENDKSDPQFETQKFCIEHFLVNPWISTEEGGNEEGVPKSFFCETFAPNLLRVFRKNRFTFFRRLAAHVFSHNSAELPIEIRKLQDQVRQLEYLWCLLLNPIDFDLRSILEGKEKIFQPQVLVPVLKSLQLKLPTVGWDGSFE